MKSVPKFLTRPFRNSLRVALDVGQTRTWLKLFLLLPRMLFVAQATRRRTSEQGEVVRPIQDVQSWRVVALVGGQSMRREGSDSPQSAMPETSR